MKLFPPTNSFEWSKPSNLVANNFHADGHDGINLQYIMLSMLYITLYTPTFQVRFFNSKSDFQNFSAWVIIYTVDSLRWIKFLSPTLAKHISNQLIQFQTSNDEFVTFLEIQQQLKDSQKFISDLSFSERFLINYFEIF